MEALCCGIHGVGVRFQTDSAALAAAAQTLLRPFQPQAGAGPAGVEIVFRAVPDRHAIPITVPAGAPLLFSRTGKTAGDALREEWGCTLYRDQGRTVADFHAQGLLCIDPKNHRVDGYLIQPEALHPEVCVSFLHFALTELLKQHGLYTLHAAGLERGGRGLLISGASGRGKTTACIALIRGGYRCLSDDHPLLRANGSGLQLLSFPVKIDVTETSIGFFPELRAAGAKLHPGVRKRYFFLEELYPGATGGACEPAVILFPQVVDGPRSYLEPLPRSRALEEVLRQGLLVFDPEEARHQFHAFSRLVAATQCYRLYFGGNVLELPRLIDAVLEPA